MTRMRTLLCALLAAVFSVGAAETPLLELYKWFHANPELSFAETKTAARLAEELRAAGLEVAENIGGNGLVAVFKNGEGPTVLIRTDLDGLPVKEDTGLPYASRAMGKDDHGRDVPVMHACGHDVHMSCAVGTARELIAKKGDWRGTVVFIGQPAEERVGGAKAMIADGLYTRFPKPDYALALHVGPAPAGTIAYAVGPATANVDSVDILVRGVGGHGAWPHQTKDPIVLSAQIVLALQTIVSRQTDPTQAAVVTVGSIHGGFKRNIISDRVQLELTLRSFSEEVRTNLIESIRRICDGLGVAAGLPADLLPVVALTPESAPSIYNDPALATRVGAVLTNVVGAKNIAIRKPEMGAEDFSEFGRTPEKVPIFMFWLGGMNREKHTEAVRAGASIPAIHSPHFAPDPEPTIATGVKAMTAAAMELLRPKRAAATKTVRVVYLVSKDREERADFKEALDHAIRDVRDWYASQLGGMTFRLHEPVVEVLRSDKDAAWFTTNAAGNNRDDWGHNNSLAETKRLLGARNYHSDHVWVVYSDGPGDKGRGGAGFTYLPENDLLGLIGKSEQFPRKERWIGGLAHELGHAFGLPHPEDTKKHYDAIMWAGFYEKYPKGAYFTDEDKKTLLASPFFSRRD